MLTDKACLVHLSISRFSGTASDKGATQDIADARATSTDWVIGRKRLLEKTALKPINRLLNEARSYHYRMTLPWDDG